MGSLTKMPNRKNRTNGARTHGMTETKRGGGFWNSRIKKGLREEAFFEIFANQPKPESLTQSEILSLETDFRTN